MELKPEETLAFILSRQNQNASADRMALRNLLFSDIRVYNGLDEAWPFLEENVPTMLILDHEVEGSATKFIRDLKNRPSFRSVPVIMVTSNSKRDFVLDAIAAGCNGFVVRPYSLDTLTKHLKVAWRSSTQGENAAKSISSATNLVWRGKYDEAISELNELVSAENETELHFNQGMEFLRLGKFGQAIVSFNKALTANQMHGDAYKGLAYAYKGKGDEEQYKEYLKKSANAFLLQDQQQKLKDVFVEILRLEPDAINPYNQLGLSLRKKGDYFGALTAYSQGLSLTPDDENLHYNIAKAAACVGDHAQARYHLGRALKINPAMEHATKLLAKVQTGTTDAEEWTESES